MNEKIPSTLTMGELVSGRRIPFSPSTGPISQGRPDALMSDEGPVRVGAPYTIGGLQGMLGAEWVMRGQKTITAVVPPQPVGYGLSMSVARWMPEAPKPAPEPPPGRFQNLDW